ncbi:MAG: response regulator transcription factor [Geobacteraceae bacterium]
MKILLVEDDKKISKLIQRGLETEYDIEVAYDGEKGLELALERSFGLIILDVMLTKKDGLTLVRDLREKKFFTPVLILSGKSSVEDIVAGLDAGADDYMTKPFDFSELTARIKALQRRSEQQRGAKIHFADLTLDPISRKVWQNDKELELSRREHELLEYLLRHPNQIITRNMIADAVWAGAVDKFTSIIDVYINYVRKKLERGTGRKFIHTVRGVGFIVKDDA